MTLDTENLGYLNILGVRVHDVTLDEALDLIARFVADGCPRQIATVNPEFVMAAQEDTAFRDVLNSAALCVPDGIGLVWTSRWLARRPGDVRLRQRVPGVELTERVAARAAREGWRVFLLGAGPGVAEKTAAVLQARYPGLIVAGTYAGSPSAEEEDTIVDMIREAGADVLFVAYGAPAQDTWIARNLDRLGVPVVIGVGGSFDFISGLTRRAPRWVQRLGLEWLHRLIRQPWRWRRQLALPLFVLHILRSLCHVSRITYHACPERSRRISRITYHVSCSMLPFLLFASVLALYVSTMTPWTVPGDPSEYTFVPRALGLAHPPGYVFYTLLAWLWQNAIRVGTLAYRTNLLAATAGAMISVLVYRTIADCGLRIADCGLQIADCGRTTNGERPTSNLQSFDFASTGRQEPQDKPPISNLQSPISNLQPEIPSLFGGLSVAVAVDIWQHSLHANAHIVSALLATLSLFLLVRWWATGDERWLYGFGLVAGLSVTQHPLLVFGFPAYGLFVLLARPRLLLQPRRLLVLLAFFALGLSAWLYIPLRGPSAPFNRIERSLEAFWQYVTAEGLRVNLFAFGLNDQLARLNVFWQLLRLQYSPLVLALAGLGVAWLALKRPRLLALFALFFVTYVSFVINTIQDVMAYLMLPFVVVGILAGVGVLVFQKPGFFKKPGFLGPGIGLLLLFVPVYTVWRTAPRVSLREYRAGQEWVGTVFARFAGKEEGAVLLAPWELMTPLWVAEAEGRALDPLDVRSVYVAATSDNPYLDGVFAHWDEGPVYLADFRRDVWEGGLFRLRPETTSNQQPATSNEQPVTSNKRRATSNQQPAIHRTAAAASNWTLWRVVAPGDKTVPALSHSLGVMFEGQVEVLGYELDTRLLRPGQTAHLRLALRVPATTTHYLMPFALLGERAYRWTTDSRALSPTWQPGEVIVERYDVTIPFGTPPGFYPSRLGVANLSAGRDLEIEPGVTTVDMGEIVVEPARGVLPPQAVLDRALANFDSRVALMGARACVAGRCVAAPWEGPLEVQPGQSIEVWLDWRALGQTGESYKAFVHLIAVNEQLAAPPADYYTPLGGAFPSSLWIPRWIEGQAVSDLYHLLVPGDLPPGDYAIQAGLYGLTSVRRVQLFDKAGNLAGDRVILGGVRVQVRN